MTPEQDRFIEQAVETAWDAWEEAGHTSTSREEAFVNGYIQALLDMIKGFAKVDALGIEAGSSAPPASVGQGTTTTG